MRPLHLIPGLFPDGVAVSAYRLVPDADAALAQLRRLGAPEIPKELANSVARRRLDFGSGRFCAREALRRIAPDLAELPIPIGADREPLWPAGITGSIAHTRGYAIAAVARSGVAAGVGVDIEHWMDEGAPARLGADLTVDGELPALVEATGWPAWKLLTLVFSAKEALYKCLFPPARQYFGLKDARVVAIVPATGEFTVQLERPVGTGRAGHALGGRFEGLGEVVVTALATRRQV